MPFSTDDDATPDQLYAATKKANELIAYTYSHLYALPATGLRFFTVYGPWGRPTWRIYVHEGDPGGRADPVYNHGQSSDDFSYGDETARQL